jgi:hypothetical protein
VPWTILITNIILSGRSGTEVVVEQLADGLRRRGHRPVIFAPQLGPLAEEMRARGHIVIDKPAALPFRPDIIHAHHTGPAMAAIAAHPGVPALFVCHDASSAFDAVPLHPRLRLIFAVDERCRARLVAEGTDAAAVQLLPNAVDLRRIPARASLPARPMRAVVFTKQSAHLPALRAACATNGIELQEFGYGVGNVIDQPEVVFAESDLVFATARTALEASAAGAGVVVCDARGCAGFLTRANAEAWLPYNFGAGILTHPCDVAQLSAAIADWTADEALAASVLVKERCGLEVLLDRLDTIYSEMLAEPRLLDQAAEAAAVGTFIAAWVPHFDQKAPWRRLADNVASPPLGSPIDALNVRLTTLAERVDVLGSPVDALNVRLTTLAEKVDVLIAQKVAQPLSVNMRLAAMVRGLWRRIATASC